MADDLAPGYQPWTPTPQATPGDLAPGYQPWSPPAASATPSPTPVPTPQPTPTLPQPTATATPSPYQGAIAQAQQRYPWVKRFGNQISITSGEGPYQSESYLPDTPENPTPGHYTIQMRSDKLKSDPSLWPGMLGRESIDWIARTDPEYQKTAQAFLQSMTPEQKALSKRRFAKDLKRQPTDREFDTFMREAELQEYIGGYLVPDLEPGWNPQEEFKYTPKQRQMLDALKQHLGVAPPQPGIDYLGLGKHIAEGFRQFVQPSIDLAMRGLALPGQIAADELQAPAERVLGSEAGPPMAQAVGNQVGAMMLGMSGEPAAPSVVEESPDILRTQPPSRLAEPETVIGQEGLPPAPERPALPPPAPGRAIRQPPPEEATQPIAMPGETIPPEPPAQDLPQGPMVTAREGYRYRDFDTPEEAVGTDRSSSRRPFGYGGVYSIEFQGERGIPGTREGEMRGPIDANSVSRVYFDPDEWVPEVRDQRMAQDLPKMRQMFPNAEFVRVGANDEGEKVILGQRALEGPAQPPEETSPPAPQETEGTPEYEAAYQKAKAASAKFGAAQQAYRARQIGDEEFLAARAEFDQSQREFDAARGETPPAQALDKSWADLEREESAAGLPAEQPWKAAPAEVLTDIHESLPRDEGIQAAEEAWAGGVGDFGDPQAAISIQSMEGYDEYRAALEERLRKGLGDRWMMYRVMAPEQYEEWQAGGSLNPMGASFSPDFAKAFANFAGMPKGADLRLVRIPVAPENVVMLGKPEEQELVINPDDISFSDLGDMGNVKSGGVLEAPAENLPAPAQSTDLEPGYSPFTEARAKPSVKPSNVYDFPTKEINKRPDVFQYKTRTDERGVTRRIEAEYDPDAAGIVEVWYDSKGEIGEPGKWYVNHGHHRTDRAEADEIPYQRVVLLDSGTSLREQGLNPVAENVTISQARTRGAIRNFQEGQGTPYDAALFMREAGVGEAWLRDQKIDLSKRDMDTALGLSKLTPPLWREVGIGRLDENVAAKVGNGLEGRPAEQDQMFGAIRYRQRNKMRVTPEWVESRIAVGLNAEQVAADSGEQMGFGGGFEAPQSTMDQQAELLEYAQSELAKDKTFFTRMPKQTGRLERAKGSVDVRESKLLATEARDKLKEMMRTVRTGGPETSRVLRRFGAYLRERPQDADAIKAEAYGQLKQALEDDNPTLFGKKPSAAEAGQGSMFGGKKGTATGDAALMAGGLAAVAALGTPAVMIAYGIGKEALRDKSHDDPGTQLIEGDYNGGDVRLQDMLEEMKDLPPEQKPVFISHPLTISSLQRKLIAKKEAGEYSDQAQANDIRKWLRTPEDMREYFPPPFFLNSGVEQKVDDYLSVNNEVVDELNKIDQAHHDGKLTDKQYAALRRYTEPWQRQLDDWEDEVSKLIEQDARSSYRVFMGKRRM